MPRFGPKVAFLAATALVTGCGGPPQSQPPAGRDNLQAIADAYVRYATAHDGDGPPDEAALKKQLADQNAADPAALFKSARDGKPYVVKYKIKLTDDMSKGNLPPDQRPKTVIIHEQDGANGTRLVAYHTGSVAEVDAAVPTK